MASIYKTARPKTQEPKLNLGQMRRSGDHIDSEIMQTPINELISGNPVHLKPKSKSRHQTPGKVAKYQPGHLNMDQLF